MSHSEFILIIQRMGMGELMGQFCITVSYHRTSCKSVQILTFTEVHKHKLSHRRGKPPRTILSVFLNLTKQISDLYRQFPDTFLILSLDFFILFFLPGGTTTLFINIF